AARDPARDGLLRARDLAALLASHHRRIGHHPRAHRRLDHRHSFAFAHLCRHLLLGARPQATLLALAHSRRRGRHGRLAARLRWTAPLPAFLQPLHRNLWIAWRGHRDPHLVLSQWPDAPARRRSQQRDRSCGHRAPPERAGCHRPLTLLLHVLLRARLQSLPSAQSNGAVKCSQDKGALAPRVDLADWIAPTFPVLQEHLKWQSLVAADTSSLCPSPSSLPPLSASLLCPQPQTRPPRPHPKCRSFVSIPLSPP